MLAETQILKIGPISLPNNLQGKMVSTVAGESVAGASIDRLQQLKVLDESKAGVKALVDNGVTRIPPIFVIPPE